MRECKQRLVFQRGLLRQDGRIRRWSTSAEMDGRYLLIILLPDQEAVHNASLTALFSHENLDENTPVNLDQDGNIWPRARVAARWAREIPALARVFFPPLLCLSPAAGAQHLTSNLRWT